MSGFLETARFSHIRSVKDAARGCKTTEAESGTSGGRARLAKGGTISIFNHIVLNVKMGRNVSGQVWQLQRRAQMALVRVSK